MDGQKDEHLGPRGVGPLDSRAGCQMLMEEGCLFPTYPPSVLGRGWSLLASAAPMLSDSEELVQDPGSGAGYSCWANP